MRKSTIIPQPSILATVPLSSTPNPQPSIRALKLQHLTFNPQPFVLNPHSETLHPQLSTHFPNINPPVNRSTDSHPFP